MSATRPADIVADFRWTYFLLVKV